MVSGVGDDSASLHCTDHWRNKNKTIGSLRRGNDTMQCTPKRTSNLTNRQSGTVVGDILQVYYKPTGYSIRFVKGGEASHMNGSLCTRAASQSAMEAPGVFVFSK